MADVSEPDFRYLDLREKLAHIDQMLADHDRSRVHTDQLLADRPWLALITGMGTGAALFAAGVAFMKLFGG
jgi:hypothetical protein